MATGALGGQGGGRAELWTAALIRSGGDVAAEQTLGRQEIYGELACTAGGGWSHLTRTNKFKNLRACLY